MSEDADYLFALQMQERWNKEDSDNDDFDFKMPAPSKKPLAIVKRSNPHSNLDEDYLNRTQNLVHPQWETLDPTPDVQSLFVAFDGKFFQSRLKCVTLEWSKRMYSCAGICYSRSNRYGMDVTIRLSEPLLKLRPRKDLVETLLHEMIHAYCFVLHIREGNGGHGPNFKKIMHGINKVAGTNITVYHTFHDEVEVYKQHWWRCNGSCQNRSPFFGYVKRTSNRAPGPNDQWWAAHNASCGGTFMKIKGPEPKQTKKKENAKEKGTAGSDIRKFLNSTSTGKQNASKDGGNKNNENKGPLKSNGGGTMVLNPKQVRSNNTSIGSHNTPFLTPIATAFPPTSYPGLSSDPFNTNNSLNAPTRSKGAAVVPAGSNLKNVVGFRDLNSSGTLGNSSRPESNRGDFGSGGYSLTNTDKSKRISAVGSKVGDQVDRNHLRDVWAKRFGGNNGTSSLGNNINSANSGNNVKKTSRSSDTSPPEAKRRRLSDASVDLVENEDDKTKAWVVVDDDVMLKNQEDETITIESDDDSDVENCESVQNKFKTLTADERHNAIKQEILDDTLDLNDEDIELIDDEFDDNFVTEPITVAAELADVSIIDEFFGEDTLLIDFNRENDVRPTGSNYVPNPGDDIITCPICQDKLKRSLSSEHFDGCTGIAQKIKPPLFAFKKLAENSQEAFPIKKPRKPRKSNRKDLLRKAGYTDTDISSIVSSSSTDEDEFPNCSIFNTQTPSNSNSTQSSGNTSSINLDDSNSDLEENTKRYRQRNVLKTTRQCPVCADEIEDSIMNDHLDVCLLTRRH